MGEWVRTRTNVFECDKKALWHRKVWVNRLGEKNTTEGQSGLLHLFIWSLESLDESMITNDLTVNRTSSIWNSKQYSDRENETTDLFFLSLFLSLSLRHTHTQTHWDREREKETPTVWYLWRMRRNFKNPWAINQSQSSRTVWQSAHIIGRQAHIRYAFSKARSKLESQLTLLIALSYLIWKTMGIEEEAFTISSSCHHSESLRLPPCFHFN